jgi:hypothetical protein
MIFLIFIHNVYINIIDNNSIRIINNENYLNLQDN